MRSPEACCEIAAPAWRRVYIVNTLLAGMACEPSRTSFGPLLLHAHGRLPRPLLLATTSPWGARDGPGNVST